LLKGQGKRITKMQNKITDYESLTFDDVLLLPALSNVKPAEVITRTRIASRIELNIPILSAAMDTVTEAPMAIAMAQSGGIGVIHRNLPIGKQVEEVGPSMPVEIQGLGGTPDAGDDFMVVADEKKAREVANFRQGKYREVRLARQQKAKLENMFSQMGQDEVAKVNIVLKADVQGSLEAIKGALEELSTDEVEVAVVSSGVGGITGTDANLALASEAIVVGFNVRADAAARGIIEREGLDLRYYSVIYDLIDDVKQALSGMLPPELREEILGVAEVREVFRSPIFHPEEFAQIRVFLRHFCFRSLSFTTANSKQQSMSRVILHRKYPRLPWL
jgi:IMP dehydrogenase/GMP reductase